MALAIKSLLANAGDVRDDSLEEGMATHSKYSCLENPTDRGAWRATVPGVAKRQTQMSDHARAKA